MTFVEIETDFELLNYRNFNDSFWRDTNEQAAAVERRRNIEPLRRVSFSELVEIYDAEIITRAVRRDGKIVLEISVENFNKSLKFWPFDAYSFLRYLMKKENYGLQLGEVDKSYIYTGFTVDFFKERASLKPTPWVSPGIDLCDEMMARAGKNMADG